MSFYRKCTWVIFYPFMDASGSNATTKMYKRWHDIKEKQFLLEYEKITIFHYKDIATKHE